MSSLNCVAFMSSVMSNVYKSNIFMTNVFVNNPGHCFIEYVSVDNIYFPFSELYQLRLSRPVASLRLLIKPP